MPKLPEWYEWTVKIRVHRTWVEDGFDLTPERAKSMIEHELSHSYGHETEAEVLSAPDAGILAKVRGE